MAALFAPSRPSPFELRFEALQPQPCSVAIPCDADGRVHMDALDRRTLCNYLFARALIGCAFAQPHVMAVAAPAVGDRRGAPVR